MPELFFKGAETGLLNEFGNYFAIFNAATVEEGTGGTSKGNAATCQISITTEKRASGTYGFKHLVKPGITNAERANAAYGLYDPVANTFLTQTTALYMGFWVYIPTLAWSGDPSQFYSPFECLSGTGGAGFPCLEWILDGNNALYHRNLAENVTYDERSSLIPFNEWFHFEVGVLPNHTAADGAVYGPYINGVDTGLGKINVKTAFAGKDGIMFQYMAYCSGVNTAAQFASYSDTVQIANERIWGSSFFRGQDSPSGLIEKAILSEPAGGGGLISPRFTSLTHTKRFPGMREVIEKDDERIYKALMEAVTSETIH